MALHTELPIYKKGCELVSLAFEVQTNMRRDFKRSLGEKITGHCTEMVNLMALDVVEVFPIDQDIVNVANIRHLFVMAEPLSFAWRKTIVGEKP